MRSGTPATACCMVGRPLIVICPSKRVATHPAVFVAWAFTTTATLHGAARHRLVIVATLAVAAAALAMAFHTLITFDWA
jgi:hypothetical protein